MFIRRLYRNFPSHTVYRYFNKSGGDQCLNLRHDFARIWSNQKGSVVLSTHKSKNFCSDTRFNEDYSVDLEFTEPSGERDIYSEEGMSFLREVLYPNSQDDQVCKLNTFSSSEMILDEFHNQKNAYGLQPMVQTAIILSGFYLDADFHSSPKFSEFIHHLGSFVPEMSPEELTCSLLYLNKIGVEAGHPTMQDLLIRSRDMIKSGEYEVSLTALSRFAVAVNAIDDIHTILVCKEVVPLIIEHLNKCKEAEELRLITICFHNLILMVTPEILGIYRSKIVNLIESGAINQDSIKCILKVLNFLSFPHWSHENSELIRRLMLLVESQIPTLSSRELEALCRIFHGQMEPAIFIPKLLDALERQYKLCPTLETFSFIAQYSPTHKRRELSKQAKQIIFQSPLALSSLPIFFRILRSLKISDFQICDKFWASTLKQILENPLERQVHRLVKHCHRYMHFNNNLGGTYRHDAFEKIMCKLLMKELSTGVSSLVPSKLSRISSFVLGYGRIENSNEKFPEVIVQKIEDMAGQFNIIDCLFLSRGVQIALEMRFRKYISQAVAAQLIKIENVLNCCAERHLRTNVNIADLNSIAKSLNYRKTPRKSLLYLEVMNKYSDIQYHLSSRTIRDITINLTAASFLIPDVLERIWEYVVNSRNYITGETTEKILTCSYNFGFTPATDGALHWAAEIIKRDFDYMTGLSILQACLALCFYKMIPENLVNKVFSVDFIKRLEDEIQNCYSKATYPERVLNQVMQLNRAVCLDYPECRVPWFQQNYLEAQMSKKPVINTYTHLDIKKLLVSLVKEEQFLRCNHVTPYGYIVDFVVHLDKNNNPIPAPKETSMLDRITKVAILPLKKSSFSEDDQVNLRGHEHLRTRHLEILGYKVLHINLNEWNSLYMNVPGAKTKYLRSLLQIQ